MRISMFRRAAAVGLAAIVLAAAAAPTPAPAGPPGKWTLIASSGVGGLTEAGLYRTPDGKLHVIWQKQAAKLGLSWATISEAGKLLDTGSALTGWLNVGATPRLVSDGGSGMRVVFAGGLDSNPGEFYSKGSVYTETSADGATWNLIHGSLAQHTVLNGTLAATAEQDGTPVAGFGLNATLWYHEGVDANAPAAAADGDISQSPAFALAHQTLITEKDDSVWMAWYRWSDNAQQGYWVDQVLPSEGTPVRAPASGNPSTGNDPGQQVAFAPGATGGAFMAYCAPTSTQSCAHIDLWKVGAASPVVVPGSSTGSARAIALSAAPQGRLWLAWLDTGKSVYHAVRTNLAGTKFGPVHTVKPPSKSFIFNALALDGSSGRADLIANIQQSSTGFPIGLWHTQVLAGLKVSAKPTKFSHTSAATVTFTVTDAGDPVAAAKVSCLGESGSTNASGVVKLTFSKGQSVGKHVCTATKAGYDAGKVTLTTT